MRHKETNELGKGKRVRKTINNNTLNDHIRSVDSQSEFDLEIDQEKS